MLISDLMYSKSIEAFDSTWDRFKTDCEEQFPIFFAYFKKMWFERKDLWSKAWRPVSFFLLHKFYMLIIDLLLFSVCFLSYKQYDRVISQPIEIILSHEIS